MKNKNQNKSQSKPLKQPAVGRSLNLCDKCGKQIKGWGIDGCPVVSEGNEMAALLGSGIEGWRHYEC